MSTMFRFFNKNSKNMQQERSESENKKRSSPHIVSRIRAYFNRDKLQLGKVRKYLARKSMKLNIANINASNDAANKSRSEQNEKLGHKSGDIRLSKMNHLSIEEGFPEKGPSRKQSMSGEEASLTQIVIAQIEHDNNRRNKETLGEKSIDSQQSEEPVSRGTNEKNALDRHQSPDQEEQSIKSTSDTNDQVFRCKLDTPLEQAPNADNAGDEPIYDIPPSKSLVNISSSIDEGISLQRQHHIQVNGEVAYFHTSSPNIFLKVEEEEAIYDTPSTRSLAV